MRVECADKDGCSIKEVYACDVDVATAMAELRRVLATRWRITPV